MTLETITAAGASIESQGTTIPSSSASTSNAAAAQVQDVLLGSLAWPGNHSFHKLVEADVSPENIVRAIRARGGRFFVFCGRCWTSLSEPLDVVRAYVDAAPERNKNSCSKPMKLDADHYLQQLYMTREFSRSTATSETLEEPNPSPILQAQLQASHATQDVPVAVPTSNSVSPTASSVQSTPSSTDKRTSPPSSSSVAPIVSTAAAAAALPAMPANYAHYASAAYPVLSYYSYFHQLNEATRKAAKLALPTVRDRLKTNTSGNGRHIKQTSKQTEKASSKSVKHGKPKKNPSMKVSRNGGPPASDVGPLPRGITARPSGKWVRTTRVVIGI
jgi:hypothetical protein